jgi:hypothetical protein
VKIAAGAHTGKYAEMIGCVGSGDLVKVMVRGTGGNFTHVTTVHGSDLRTNRTFEQKLRRAKRDLEAIEGPDAVTPNRSKKRARRSY